MKIHSNSCLKWIMNNALLQHGSKWASLLLFKNTYKTNIILIICSKWSENGIDAILYFLKISSNIAKWPLRAPGERPEAPREASDSPDKHQNPCQWTQNHVKFIGFHNILWISLHSIWFYRFSLHSTGIYGFHWIP